MEKSEAGSTGIGSSWGFVFRQEGSWKLAAGQRGDLWILPLGEDLQPAKGQRTNATKRGKLTDHAFRPCPDGGFLLASSDHVSTPNHLFRFDASFGMLGSSMLPQGKPVHAANDVTGICGNTWQGIGTAEWKGERDYFWAVDGEGAPSARKELPRSPRLTGAALAENGSRLVVIGNEVDPALPPPGLRLAMRGYREDGSLAEEAWVTPEGFALTQFWATQLLPLGSSHLLLAIGRDPSAGWLFDTGNVYLGVLDAGYNLEEWIQLTDFPPKEGGAMRPWMARDGDRLAVVFDRWNKLHMVEVRLDPRRTGKGGLW